MLIFRLKQGTMYSGTFTDKEMHRHGTKLRVYDGQRQRSAVFDR